MFIKNNLFSLYHFYADLAVPELYLVVKKEQDACSFLRGADVEIDEVPEDGKGSAIFICGEENIRKAFQAFERAQFLSTDEVSDSLQRLIDKLPATGFKSPKASSSLPLKSTFGSHITLQDHQAEAITAAKEGNTLLVQILLGNQITERDHKDFKTASINLDVGRDQEYRAEFEREVCGYQLEVLKYYLALPEESREIGNLVKDLERCIRRAKADVVGVKFSQIASSKPYVLNDPLETDEKFEDWLNMIFDQHIASGVCCKKPDSSTDLAELENALNDQIESADGLACKLKLGREQVANDFYDVKERLSKKEKEHLTLIESFLAEPRFLPALYQYQNDMEKQALIVLLQAVKIPVDTLDEDGNTLLHHALNRMHLGSANVLLQQEADVNVRNRAGQTAAQYAGINQEVISQLKASPVQMLVVQSKFLKEVEAIFREYEPRLASKENDLQSSFWSIFVDKDLVEERRQKKTEYETKHAEAKRTGNFGVLAGAIEVSSPPARTRRGLLGKSSFHDKLMEVVRRFRENPEEYGLSYADKTIAFLIQENNELRRALDSEKQRVEELTKENEILRTTVDAQSSENLSLKDLIAEQRKDKASADERAAQQDERAAQQDERAAQQDEKAAQQDRKIAELAALIKQLMTKQQSQSTAGNSSEPGHSSGPGFFLTNQNTNGN